MASNIEPEIPFTDPTWLHAIPKENPNNQFSRVFNIMAAHSDTVGAPGNHYSKWARYCGLGLYVNFAVVGCLDNFNLENGVLGLVELLLTPALACGWAVTDAKARGLTFLHIARLLFFLVWPVGAVIYLCYRSGWRGLLTAVLHAVGLTVVCGAAFFTTWYVLHD